LVQLHLFRLLGLMNLLTHLFLEDQFPQLDLWDHQDQVLQMVQMDQFHHENLEYPSNP
jgi:hypothetical protein